MCRQSRHQALRSLRQTETRPEIYRQCRNDKRSNKAPAYRSRALSSFYQRPEKHNQEYRKRKHLEGKSGKQDVVWSRRILLIGISDADQSSSRNLNDRGRDVADNEDPEDQLRRHWRVLPAVDADHDGDEGVNRRREEDRRDHDEEVLLLSSVLTFTDTKATSERAHLNHKPRNRIRVLLARQYAERIPDNFHRCAYDDRAEVPGAMAQEQEKVSCESNGEDHDAEDSDDERWRISFNLVNFLLMSLDVSNTYP